MTNKEILQADLLDILFEHRNKAYGAYALRKYYNHRLVWALGISLTSVLFLLTINAESDGSGGCNYPNPDVVLRQVEIPSQKKTKTQEIRQQKKLPALAQIQSTAIKIVANDQIRRPEVPTINDLQGALISTINKAGLSPDSAAQNLPSTKVNGNTNDQTGIMEPEFRTSSSQAQFPGGKEAFAEFLKRYLNIPYDLEAGEKKVVLVRFMVDVDGVISKTEIIQSGGDAYDREVIRVLRKMPKWIPAMQNGMRVATYFTQPVTFIGIEE